jgi:26S proteasome regulatory subunit N2
VEEKKEDEKKLVATAVLSTTAKAKAREARKEARKQGVSREGTSEGPSLERVTSHLSTASYLSFDELKPTDSTINNDSKKKDKEPSSFTLTNPARVIPSQVRFISLQPTQRYAPVSRRCVNPAGIVMLIDSTPSNPESVLKVERLAIGQEDEADAPEPFEWSPDSA